MPQPNQGPRPVSDPREVSQRILAHLLERSDRAAFEDLLADQPSREVMAAYCSETLDEKSSEALDEYFDSNPQHRAELDELESFILSAPKLAAAVSQPLQSSERKRQRGLRRRRASLLLFSLCAAAGYGGGVWHGRHSNELTFEESLRIGSDPNQPARQGAIARIQRLFIQTLPTIEAAATDDPGSNVDKSRIERLGRSTRYRLYTQARLIIEALGRLHSSRKSHVSQEAGASLKKLQDKLKSLRKD